MDLDPKRLSRFVAAWSVGILCLASAVHAGFSGNSRNAVGGVMIDGAGVVRAATIEEQKELAKLVRESTEAAPGDMAKVTDMRMISLRGLQQAIIQANQAGTLPDEVEFLAGLQRIEYVFVDKDKHDIVIAGPAEPWVFRNDGSVVGKVTGGSTMRLVDLVVALRAVETARNGGISCSIEPTAEGRRRLQQMLSHVQLRPGQNPVGLEASMKEAFGPQMIYLAGIPTDSRYARTLVAADFEMKRVAMGLTPSPVARLAQLPANVEKQPTRSGPEPTLVDGMRLRFIVQERRWARLEVVGPRSQNVDRARHHCGGWLGEGGRTH